MKPTFRLFLLASLAAAATACGDSSSSSTPTDTGGSDTTDATDASGDSGEDAGTDVGTDSGDDTGTDVGTDSGEDATGDTGTDTQVDVDPTLDSDDDGLSDADEINIWGTSPDVADTDGDGFSDKVEVVDLAFDPEVDNFQFNPLIADRPILEIELALAPVIYATYETTEGITESVGQERSDETRSANSRSWGGSNSYAVEQSHTAGATVGFSGWSLEGSVSYEYSYSTTSESTSEWSEEQTNENATTLSSMTTFEESNEITSSGGVLGVTVEVSNPGNIAYFLDNLTLTSYELDPLNPENTSPIGALTFLDGVDTFPRTRLEPGETSAPLAFDAELDLPTVKALLADSRNLMIAPATWLIEGDGTVDFELAATAVNARTAEIIIDYGFDRAVEKYRISTVAVRDRNYITVDEALSEILRIPYTQGVSSFRRDPDAEPTDTVPMLTSVRSFGTSDEDATLWTVIHSYPINNGADTQVDQYHPLSSELDFGALQLQKGHTLQLIRIVDTDRDGLGERSEYAYGTDPNNADTDDDGCEDGFEVNGWWVGEGEDAVFYRSSPVLPNTDYDLFDDCEEYEDGTDPMSADNTPPTATVTRQTDDGVRAVFSVAFSDPETDVLEIRYTVDGGSEQTMDVSALSSPVAIERTFGTAGEHSIEVVAFDGALLSPPSSATHNVDTPMAGVISHWPITGSSDGMFFGEIQDVLSANHADADPVWFVTGRDGIGRGAAHVNFGGDHGIFHTGSVDLGSNFTVSAWVRFESIYSDYMYIFGQHDRFAFTASPSAIRFHDMHGYDYADDRNEAVYISRSGGWDDDSPFYHFAVTVAGTTARVYINGSEVGTSSINADTDSCALIFGHPSSGETECGGVSAAEDHENGINAVFDDIWTYNRALSANEIRALHLN